MQRSGSPTSDVMKRLSLSASDEAPSKEEKKDGMLSKLFVTIDGETIELHAHEVVKLVHDAVELHAKNLSKKTFAVPDYTELDQAVDAEFDSFSDVVLSGYAQDYRCDKDLLVQYLDEAKSPSYLVHKIQQWFPLLEKIKKIKEQNGVASFLEKNDIFPFLPIPPQIKNIADMPGWMQLAQYVSKSKDPIRGWWLLIADRVLFVKNTPEEKNTHFYVSDHGNLENVTQQTYACTMQHSLKASDEVSAMFGFYRLYAREIPSVEVRSALPKLLKPNAYYIISKTPSDPKTCRLIFIDENKKQEEVKMEVFPKLAGALTALPPHVSPDALSEKDKALIKDAVHEVEKAGCYFLSTEEKGYLKDSFINALDDKNMQDPAYLQLLLVSFGYPHYLRQRIIDEKQFKWPTMIGALGHGERELVRKPASSRIHDLRYPEYEDVFYTTLEQARYFALLNEQYARQLFQHNMSVFFTQVSNVMTQIDAPIFEACYLQAHMKKLVSHGDHQVMFRTVDSYGKRDNGDSYREFSLAFSRYLSSDQALTPSQLAKKMRSVLKGDAVKEPGLAFLVNLVAAWFVAESARNLSTLVSSLMLLDLIESNRPLMCDGENLYSWKHVFLHPKEGQTKMVTDLYGQEIKSEDKKTDPIFYFRGSHPMVHKASVQQSKTRLSNGTHLTPVRQKEGSLFLHWLSVSITEQYPEVKIECVPAKKVPLVDKPSYDELEKVNVDKLSKNSSKNKKLKAKWRLITEIVKPLINDRLSKVDNMLQPQPEPTAKKTATQQSFQASGVASSLTLGFMSSLSLGSDKSAFDFKHDLEVWEDLELTQATKNSLLDAAASQQVIVALKTETKRFGFDCQDVSRDGLCLLHVIQDQLTRLHQVNQLIPVIGYQELQQKLVNHVLENIAAYQSFSSLSSYELASQALDYKREWAGDMGDLAALVLSRILNMTIVIISSRAETEPRVFKQAASLGTLYLGYEQGRHYQSLIRDDNDAPERSIQAYIDHAAVDVGLAVPDENKPAMAATR